MQKINGSLQLYLLARLSFNLRQRWYIFFLFQFIITELSDGILVSPSSSSRYPRKDFCSQLLLGFWHLQHSFNRSRIGLCIYEIGCYGYTAILVCRFGGCWYIIALDRGSAAGGFIRQHTRGPHCCLRLNDVRCPAKRGHPTEHWPLDNWTGPYVSYRSGASPPQAVQTVVWREEQGAPWGVLLKGNCTVLQLCLPCAFSF